MPPRIDVEAWCHVESVQEGIIKYRAPSLYGIYSGEVGMRGNLCNYTNCAIVRSSIGFFSIILYSAISDIGIKFSYGSTKDSIRRVLDSYKIQNIL